MWRALTRKSLKTYAVDESLEKKPQALSNYEEVQIRRQQKKQVQIAAPLEPSPPTLLASQEASAPRPSMLVAVRRSTVSFRAWMGKLVKQKSSRPSILSVGSEESESREEEELLGFLAAYLTGDLEVLDTCLRASAKEQGQRSFVAIAQERGEFSLQEWLRAFRRLKVPPEQLRRCFALLRRLTAEPRRQLKESARSEIVIFSDFQEAPEQVAWATTLAERLVRGTGAAELSRSAARRDVPAALRLVDGPMAPRLARAAARAAQRELWLDVATELRLLWALSGLEPRATQQLLRPVARHLGFVLRCAARRVIADEGAKACSADWEEALLLALRLAYELGWQQQCMGKALNATLLEALQPKSLLLTVAAAMQLLSRELVSREELLGEAFWHRMASQLLGDVWRLVDQAYDTTALRPLMASVARSAGLTPSPRDSLEAQEAPLALRSAAVASGSHQVCLGKRLLRPARVPLTGLAEVQQGGASSSVRSRAPQGSTEEALGALCEGLAAMAAPELRSAALYGAALLAERLGEPRRVQELLRPALAELVLGAEAARHQREGRKQIHGDAARAEEIREVRRSWNAEVEMQWFDLLRGAESEDEDSEGSALA